MRGGLSSGLGDAIIHGEEAGVVWCRSRQTLSILFKYLDRDTNMIVCRVNDP